MSAFYGTRNGDYTPSRAAFQTHLAESDEWVSAATVKKLKASLAAAGRQADFHVYPGTGHWFFESDRAGAYEAGAAGLAWGRTVAFLRLHLKPAGRGRWLTGGSAAISATPPAALSRGARPGEVR